MPYKDLFKKIHCIFQYPNVTPYILGERLIQYASEYLVTEVLISPQLNTLQQCMKNMLGSFTKHRHILHGGYTFAGTGAWALQVIFKTVFCIAD
jgi:hypothetical protein